MDSLTRVLLIVAVMVAVHFTVVGIRRFSHKLTASRISPRLSRTRTVASLATSFLIFMLYFGALGLILSEFGVSLKAYLASASIMGLAIGFGSQGLVQDVVNGVTIVFSGLFDVGDMVEISGQTGIVRKFGMRFTVIENSFGANMYIPNRTITNVMRYPKGYIQAIADITMPDDPNITRPAAKKVSSIVASTFHQLPGILLAPPSIDGMLKTGSGKRLLRIKFNLWPGRGTPIETIFKQEVVSAMKEFDPDYQDWMVTVNYEIEQRETRP